MSQFSAACEAINDILIRKVFTTNTKKVFTSGSKHHPTKGMKDYQYSNKNEAIQCCKESETLFQGVKILKEEETKP